MKYRIAVGGIAVESCTFSPLPTQFLDFDIAREAELMTRLPFLADFDEAKFIPLVQAYALPGGSVAPTAYTHLKDELLDGLRAHGPWDGVYLNLHGAMHVHGMRDAEGDLVSAVRVSVGPNCLIAASYDLHGNVSAQVVDHLDVLTAYRTAPHIDTDETRRRACALLLQCLRQRLRPYKAFISIPLLLPGERAMTMHEPAQGLYARLPHSFDHDLLDMSLLVGYAWADEPRTGASVVAFGANPAVVERSAQHLAQAYWDARHAFRFPMPTGSVDECITAALAESEDTVFISDAGDNVTGGAVGDVTYVIDRLCARNVSNVLVASVVDATAVKICQSAGIEAEVAVVLGGKLDPQHGRPLPVRGRVLKLDNTETGNHQAVLVVRNIKIILTERRTAFTTLAQFERLGLNLLEHRIVVVKLGYLFPDLQRVATKAWLALSPGALNPAVEQLAYNNLGRPIFPLDPTLEWAAKTERVYTT